MRSLCMVVTVLFFSPLMAVVGSAGVVRADNPVAAQMVEGDNTALWGYTPAPLSVAVGQSVIWSNIGKLPHTATDDSGSWDTGLVSPGAVATLAYTASGTYAYHCQLHPWMKGTVVVTEQSDPIVVVPEPSDSVPSEMDVSGV